MAAVENLLIEQGKIDDYLLNINHVDGWSKAKFFLGRGFSLGAPQDLANALAQHAIANWPGQVAANTYVTKHIVTGPLACPDGTTPDVLAIWKLIDDGVTASLVTAYPHR